MPTAPAEPTGVPGPAGISGTEGRPGAGRPVLYPVSLVIAGRPCLVVGGGPVAARKAGSLAECAAQLTVVAPHVGPAMEELSARWPMAVERRPYRTGEAAGYRLVVAATGVPGVDAAVAADAEATGAWVNCADDPDGCSFMLPAVYRDEPVTVAVSTTGASPALASWLRHRVAEQLGAGLGALADLLDAARRELKGRGLASSVDWRALLDGRLPALVAAGRIDEARQLIDEAAASGTGSAGGHPRSGDGPGAQPSPPDKGASPRGRGGSPPERGA